MNKLDLSPSTDHTLHLILSDSEAILSRELFKSLRVKGHSAVEAIKIVHVHNGYDSYRSEPVKFSDCFKRR